MELLSLRHLVGRRGNTGTQLGQAGAPLEVPRCCLQKLVRGAVNGDALRPSKQPIDFPTLAVTAQHAPVLSGRSASIVAMRRDYLDIPCIARMFLYSRRNGEVINIERDEQLVTINELTRIGAKGCEGPPRRRAGTLQ